MRRRAPRSEESRELSRLRANAFWADPANRARQSEFTKRRMARPGVSERISLATASAMADPAIKARQRAGLKAAWADPQKREEHARLTRERMAAWRAARLEEAAKVLRQLPRAEREAALAGLAKAGKGGAG